MSDDYVTDAFGNIDDFRATPGRVGTPISRRMAIRGAVPSELMPYLQMLSKNGYSKKEVCDVLIHMLNLAYGNEAVSHIDDATFWTGDLVQIPERNYSREADGHAHPSRKLSPGLIVGHRIDIRHRVEVKWGDAGEVEEWDIENLEVINESR